MTEDSALNGREVEDPMGESMDEVIFGVNLGLKASDFEVSGFTHLSTDLFHIYESLYARYSVLLEKERRSQPVPDSSPAIRISGPSTHQTPGGRAFSQAVREHREMLTSFQVRTSIFFSEFVQQSIRETDRPGLVRALKAWEQVPVALGKLGNALVWPELVGNASDAEWASVCLEKSQNPQDLVLLAGNKDTPLFWKTVIRFLTDES